MPKLGAFFCFYKGVMANLLREQLKKQFKANNIDAVDVDYIFAYCLNIPRTEIIFVNDLKKADEKRIKKYAKLRLKHKPLNKIFKKSYFYNLQFKINNNVLAPRQDSELLVDSALNYLKTFKILPKVLDLCTGSGCLAISIKKFSNAQVYASDISKKALKVAKYNAKLNSAEIKFIHSNMFKKIKENFDVVISNPPYIPSKEIELLDDEVKNFDPLLSLDGGQDGLKFYRIIANNLQALKPNGYLILEIGENQAQSVKKIMSKLKFEKCVTDYNNIERVLIFKKEQI